ncbi:MAG: hypothetical protein CMP23_14075 [Rickettsiales bacterium]|nr:hypothetical protein [Rickettsiales bacterium]|tara:strand:+ start:1507 stop:2769 length:1263 start_codon:yes stop_codon:yes gene_type:complete
MSLGSPLAVEGLWKRFRVRPHNDTGKFSARSGDPLERWALRGVSFDIPAGGALGVIGANGSGKSTLLSLVAGVLQPTQGRIRKRGRTVAILNPTAGFHPDLSGRANIRMLATLHGFGRADIESRMDAIIQFSGLGDFIDQPLRTFSAGMMIRLGFSTASHLDPDILVVDEVLSAGDLAFQRQALGRARDLRQQGTALLVSTHSLADLSTLCDRLMFLDGGEVRSEGSADEVVASYIQHINKAGSEIAPGLAVPTGLQASGPGDAIRLLSVTVNGQQDPARVEIAAGDPLAIELEYEARVAVDDALFRVQFFRNDGLFVHGQNTARAGLETGVLEGRGRVRLEYSLFGLLGGDYFLSAGIWPDEYRSYTTGEAYDHRPSATIVRVGAPRQLGGGVAGFPCSWSLQRELGGQLTKLGRGEAS